MLPRIAKMDFYALMSAQDESSASDLASSSPPRSHNLDAIHQSEKSHNNSGDEDENPLQAYYALADLPTDDEAANTAISTEDSPHMDSCASHDSEQKVKCTDFSGNQNSSQVPSATNEIPHKNEFLILRSFKWNNIQPENNVPADYHENEVFTKDILIFNETDVECFHDIEGDRSDDEDGFVIISGNEEPSIVVNPSDLPVSSWKNFGKNVFSVVNNTARKAGEIIYYTASGVSETTSKIYVEVKSTLAKGSDVAILSVVSNAATETLLFAIDRGRLAGHHVATVLKGDPEASRRLHLRRLLASGSWAEFSIKCQLATLPWYDRQLIHLTRYDNVDTDTLLDQSLNKSIKQSQNDSTCSTLSSTTTQQSVVTRHNTTAFDAESTNSLKDAKKVSAVMSLQPVQFSLNGEATSISKDTKDDKISLQYKNKLGNQPDNSVSLDNSSTQKDYSVPSSHAKNAFDSKSDSEFHQWLLEMAKSGNADAEYALSKWFTPPVFTENNKCEECHAVFSISKFRHHCRHCGKSYCGDHSNQTRVILKYGMPTPVRVCTKCAIIVDKENKLDWQKWRQERLNNYYEGKLIPYFELAVDRGVDKAMRFVENHT